MNKLKRVVTSKEALTKASYIRKAFIKYSVKFMTLQIFFKDFKSLV
jgi:hypothetical protein